MIRQGFIAVMNDFASVAGGDRLAISIVLMVDKPFVTKRHASAITLVPELDMLLEEKALGLAHAATPCGASEHVPGL
jgi:hypothetical protein